MDKDKKFVICFIAFLSACAVAIVSRNIAIASITNNALKHGKEIDVNAIKCGKEIDLTLTKN